MDYKKIYDSFIEDRRQHPTGEIRAEIHHIIPISAGGDVTENNCIRLSIRDHVFAHKVLRKLGMDPNGPHKRMSKSIAKEIYTRLVSQPVAAYGRGKTAVSVKTLNNMVKKKDKELVELGNEMVDRFIKIIDPGVERYTYSIARTARFNKKLTAFFANIVPSVKISRTDTAHKPQYSDLPESAGCYVEKNNVQVENMISITAGGQTKLTIWPTKINGTFLKSGPWQGLVHRWIYTNLGQLYSELEKNGGRMTPGGCRICRSKDEFMALREEAAVYGYWKATGMKPGKYKAEDIVRWSCQGIQQLLLQYTALHHLKDLRTSDIVDVYDLGLRNRLQALPEKLDPENVQYDPDAYDQYFECLSRQVMARVLRNVAFTPDRVMELMPVACKAAYGIRRHLPTAIRSVREAGHLEEKVPTWRIAATFMAKYGLAAVRDIIEKGKAAA